MMDCSRFLKGYSEFRDGLLGAEARSEFTAHVGECESCARYHRVVAEGVGILRELPEPTPSEDFGARLQHRLFHVDDEMRRFRSFPRSGFAVAATAAILLVVSLSPLTRDSSPLPELPAVAAHAPSSTTETPALLRSGPFLGPSTASNAYPPAQPGLRLPAAAPTGAWLTGRTDASHATLRNAID